MAASSQAQPMTKEYYVRVPKTKKRYHALKFHSANDVDPQSWIKPEMLRETNPYQTRSEWENLPKFGAGSEFNRENKEMSRRKKLGFNTRTQTTDDLPWLLNIKGEATKDKQFRGKKSISDNSSYYVFILNADGGFEAYPLEDWYAFTPHRTYKVLNIDEAEEEFSKRHKILNKYAIMANRRKAEAEENETTDEKSKKTTKKSKEFALTELDEWDLDEDVNGDEENKSDGERLSDDDDDKKKSKNKKKDKKKKKDDNDEEEIQLHEDSDDGDEEGREEDYETDETDTEEEEDTTKVEEKYQEIGIDQEEAMKALEKEDDTDEEDEKLTEEGKEYKKLITEGYKDVKDDDELSKDSAKKSSANDSMNSDSSDDSDTDDPDNDPTIVSTLLLDRKKTTSPFPAIGASETTSLKRKAAHDELSLHASKRSYTITNAEDELFKHSGSSTVTTQQSTLKTSASTSALQSTLPNEGEVRKYLQRKPMTTKEILIKLKKRSEISKEKLYDNLSAILKKLTDLKLLKIDEINGTKYLSLIK